MVHKYSNVKLSDNELNMRSKFLLLARGDQHKNPNTVIETLEEVLFKAVQPKLPFSGP